MSDRELIELAAKASGLCIESWSANTERAWVYPEGTVPNKDREYSGCVLWNPLIDDGDALRLAVTMRVDIEHFPSDSENGRKVAANDYARIYSKFITEPEALNKNMFAATRRAIVRAAAEIGKSMLQEQDNT